QEDQAGDDERDVRLPGHLLHPAAEAHPEDHEVEKGGDQRAEHGLARHAEEAAHLLDEQGPEAGDVHASPPPLRSTSSSTSSSRLARVSTSCTGMPAR